MHLILKPKSFTNSRSSTILKLMKISSALTGIFDLSAALFADKMHDGGDRHISYHFGLDLPSDHENEEEDTGHLGTDVLLRIILTNGSRFKILGLSLCE